MLCFVSHGFAALRSVSLTVYHGESLEAREHDSRYSLTADLPCLGV